MPAKARPMMEESPVASQSELGRLYTTVSSLPAKRKLELVTWITLMMKPRYARSIRNLPKASSSLLLVSAGALYSALFSPEAGVDGDTEG